MLQPKLTKTTHTTVQDVLVSVYGNQAITARLLKCNRSTLAKMIDDNRQNVVLINEDGSYKLLK